MPDPDKSIWGNCFATITTGSRVDYVATLSCLPYFIKNIVDMAIALAGAVAVFFIVWGGIQYIRSGGDPKQAEGARHTITYAIVGLIVVLMAYFILSVVAQLTGADCIKMLGFTNCQTPVGDTATTPTDSERYGCFYGITKLDGTIFSDRTCYTASPGNDPVMPRQWFEGGNASSECAAFCRSVTVQ